MVNPGSILRWMAAAIALVIAAIWVFCGANTGWTKTSVPVKTLDEVTGIEGIHYEKKFLPGLDFLGLGAVAVSGLLIGSFLLPARRNANASTNA
jgi:hypothetical protein